MSDDWLKNVLREAHEGRTGLTSEDHDHLLRSTKFWSWFEQFMAARWCGKILAILNDPDRFDVLEKMRYYNGVVSKKEFYCFAKAQMVMFRIYDISFDDPTELFAIEDLVSVRSMMLAFMTSYKILRCVHQLFTPEEKELVSFLRGLDAHPWITSFQPSIKGKGKDAKLDKRRSELAMLVHSPKFDLPRFVQQIESKLGGVKSDLEDLHSLYQRLGRPRPDQPVIF